MLLAHDVVRIVEVAKLMQQHHQWHHERGSHGTGRSWKWARLIHRACRHSFTPEPSDDYHLRSFLSVLDQQASNNVSFALEVGSFFQYGRKPWRTSAPTLTVLLSAA